MKMMSRVLYVLLLAVLLLAPGAQAKSAPPGPGPAPDVRFPTFEEKTLSNGLRLVVIEQHEQPVVSLRLVTKGGRSYEPEGKSGLAEAVASLLPKGTTTRSSQQIAEAIDFVGGNVGAFTGIEFAYATAAVTSDQLGLGFDLLADVVLHPTFPEDEVERWRRQALSTLQVQQQSGSYLASRAVERLVLGQHPYGRVASGTPESVRGLTREDFAAFHKRLYVPNGSILAIVGDIKAADAFARAESAFGKWSKGESPTLPKVEIPDRKTHQIVVVDKPDAVQSEIRLAQPSIAFRDPDLFVAEVYNSVTGGHVASRLYEEIRRKRGLSYGAQSFFAEPTQPGWFEATTFTKTESTVEALELALEVLRGLQAAPVPAAELDLAKINITGAFPLEIETAEGIADKVLEAMRFGYGREFLETYNDKISAVTAADVQRFAKERIHPDRMTIVLVGNASAFSGDLKKKFGELETIPAAELDLLQADLRKPKAQQAVPAASDPKGLELLRQAQAALGGKAFLEQKTQIAKGSGTLSPPGMPQPMAIPALISYRVYPDKERSEIQLPMGTMIQAFDGTNGWAGMGSQMQDNTAQAKADLPYGFDVLRRAAGSGYTARSLPDADVAGKPVQVIEVADAEGHATRFFLDPQTHLVTKVAYEANGQTSEAVYTDYRDVSGIKIAHQTNVSQNGSPLVEIKYSEVQVNAPVDEGVFKKPGA